MLGETISDWIVGLMMALFGLIGLVLLIGARDEEIFIFGATLTIFAVLFDLDIIRRRRAQATVKAKGPHHG